MQRFDLVIPNREDQKSYLKRIVVWHITSIQGTIICEVEESDDQFENTKCIR